MADEAATNLPLDDAQSSCTAPLLVDAIGVDVLPVDGELVDPDWLPVEYDAAAQALVTVIDDRDIAPAQLCG
jgi:hypothetical protein